jgi:hypothetical protein
MSLRNTFNNSQISGSPEHGGELLQKELLKRQGQTNGYPATAHQGKRQLFNQHGRVFLPHD